MKCYVINLDQDADRLEFMRNQFVALGLQFDRIPATDLRAEGSRQRITPQPAKLLSNAEVGCFQSHIAAWQRIIDSAAPYGCVFEDDVAIATDAGHLLKSTDWIPKGAGIIKLETAFTQIELGQRRSPATAPYETAMTQGNYGGSAAYIISRSACQRLLRESQVIEEAVDLFLFSSRLSVQSWQVVPAPCVQLLNLKKASYAVAGPDFSSNIAGTYALDARSRRSVWVRLRRRLSREVRRRLYSMAPAVVEFAFTGWTAGRSQDLT